jgi:hypothetical protein
LPENIDPHTTSILPGRRVSPILPYDIAKILLHH